MHGQRCAKLYVLQIIIVVSKILAACERFQRWCSGRRIAALRGWVG